MHHLPNQPILEGGTCRQKRDERIPIRLNKNLCHLRNNPERTTSTTLTHKPVNHRVIRNRIPHRTFIKDLSRITGIHLQKRVDNEDIGLKSTFCKVGMDLMAEFWKQKLGAGLEEEGEGEGVN